MKLKWTIPARPTLTKAEDLAGLLVPFGAVEIADIVLSLKPPPPKKPKRGTALVPFKQIGDAFAAVCSSGSAARGLHDVEISWAEGKEPGLIGWLKKMGKLGGESKAQLPPNTAGATSPTSYPSTGRGAGAADPNGNTGPYSSFPSTFVSLAIITNCELRSCAFSQPDIDMSLPTAPEPSVKGLDYESLTLMRLRQAERERLEREIREQEATES